ncbi:MAG: DUF6017 domain-containing protein [Oscillospiraceae bacterium]
MYQVRKSITDVSITDPILSFPDPLLWRTRQHSRRNGKDGSEITERREIYRQIIMDNIGTNTFASTSRALTGNAGRLPVDLLVKPYSAAGHPHCRGRLPGRAGEIKFMKLDSSHIEFVFDCLSKNTSEIRNIKKYLLAMLFNAPSTINRYYAALVAHDVNCGKI